MVSKIPIGSIWARKSSFGEIRIRITSTDRFEVWFKHLNDDGTDMDVFRMHISESMSRKLLLLEFHPAGRSSKESQALLKKAFRARED